MQKETTLNFPDINEAFIGNTTLNGVCRKYVDILNSTNTFYNNQYANKLLEFLEIDHKINLLELEFRQFKSFLRKWSKANNVKLKLLVRKKHFIGFNSKIRMFLIEHDDLENIRDLLGFRVILLTDKLDSIESHRLHYKLMNECLLYFISKRNALLLNAGKNSGKPLKPDSKMAKQIFIYNNSELLLEFRNKVKNYSLQPKFPGYQGLHAHLKTLSGLIIELQIRTMAMDLFAESIHEQYKKERYSNFEINLDYEKINLPGLIFDENFYLVKDYVGLFTSVDPFYII